MIKKLKMSTLISLSIGFISFVCMTFLVVFISTKASDVVTGQAGLIEQFVENSDSLLRRISKSSSPSPTTPSTQTRRKTITSAKDGFYNGGAFLSGINNNVKIIQSISSKTHLLAINASIEALRDMINELDGFIGKNMETVKDINDIVSRFER